MMHLDLDDSRRLTGPNLLSNQPGAVIDVLFRGVTHEAVIDAWRTALDPYLAALGWAGAAMFSRTFTNPDDTPGASLAFAAPIDALYAATEVNEAAWAAACAQLQQQPPPDFAADVTRLRAMIDEEANPALLQLHSAAQQHGLPFLSDDDDVSVGYGRGSRTWSVSDIPAPDGVDWQAINAIPLALITGTNGKSTSVRLAASVLEAAGLRTGTTSTDFIKVGGRVLDSGDYSGPGGARTLLRHPEVEVAVLEVARGGILRRGLGVERADASLITNVAADHLGQYGINSVPELIETKFVVHKALHAGSTLVLNADDAGITGYAAQLLPSLDCRVCWFSESVDNPLIQSQLTAGGQAAFVQDGRIILANAGQQQPVAPVRDIPVTLNGAARHNVQNCLGVAALCQALGIETSAIAAGLQNFSSDPNANPGRGNLFEFNGCRALVDFAHNEHGYSAMAQTVANLPAERRLVMLAQAGDRSDTEIRAMTAAACRLNPDRVVICSLGEYLRGRPEGEVEGVIRGEILRHGIDEDSIHLAPGTLDGVNHALDWAQPGDLLFLQVLTDRERVFAQMRRLTGQ